MKSVSKSVFVSVVSILVVACFVASSYAADAKVAIVDVDQLFDKYQKTVDFNTTLEAQVEKKQAERDAMVDDIRRMKDELVLLNDEGRADKQAEIDQLIQSLQQYDEVTREELAGQRNEYMQEILLELDTKVKEYGKKKGYDYIFNGRLVLYKKDKYDVTETLVEEVNKDYKA